MPRQSAQRPPTPPADAKEGADHIRAFTLKLFARDDGEAVEWPLIADSLFRAAFAVLDKLPPELHRTVARRVHEGSYNRLTAGDDDTDSGAGQGDDLGSVPASSNRLFKTTAPRPPRVGH